MGEAFIRVLNVSITAGWLILAVAAARLLLKKAPKWVFCLLWALVALRLVCPVSVKSVMSLIPSRETVPPSIVYDAKPEIYSGIAELNSAVNPVLEKNFSAPVQTSGPRPLQTVFTVAAAVWIAGMAAMTVYSLICYGRLKKRVSASVPVEKGVFLCDEVRTPFILGIFRPKIYLPPHLSGQAREYVIAHERAHLRRRDHWWKPLGYALLTVYWFHPLCWLAYVFLCRDIERACDEKVIRDLERGQLADYSQVLLDCSAPRRAITACPLAFGEVGTKRRVKDILNYKKPAFWIILSALVLCAVLALCLLTDPAGLSRKELQQWDPLIKSVLTDQAEKYRDGSENTYVTMAYDVFGSRRSGKQTKFYVWVSYVAAVQDEHGFCQVTPLANLPAEIVFGSGGDPKYGICIESEAPDGSYVSSIYRYSAEYRTPREGENYAKDVRSIFPFVLWGKAFDSTGNSRRISECSEAIKTHFADASAQVPEDPPVIGNAVPWTDDSSVSGAGSGSKIKEITVAAFPDTVFQWEGDTIRAISGGETKVLYSGWAVLDVYFCDLTGDGKPELCFTVCTGSGIFDYRVTVYDYAEGNWYQLADRFQYDYVLSLRNGDLYIEQYHAGDYHVPYKDLPQAVPIAVGRPVLENGKLKLAVSADVRVEEPTARRAAACWVDFSSTARLVRSKYEVTINAFPDTVFQYVNDQVFAIRGGETTLLYSYGVRNVYFCDLTGDGKPELCSMCRVGSGIVSEFIVVYDYAEGCRYMLWDHMKYDYALSLRNGDLYAEQYVYPHHWQSGAKSGDTPVAVGRLVLKDGLLKIEVSAET